MLSPVNGVNVDALLDHLPEGADKKQSVCSRSGVNTHTYLISLNFWTVATSFSTTKSTSASVVNRPKPNRKEEWAMSSAAPRALRTYDGSNDADVQALPEERAISFKAMRRLSPSTYAKLRLTHPGYPLISPFRTTRSILDPSPSMRRWASFWTLAWSLCGMMDEYDSVEYKEGWRFSTPAQGILANVNSISDPEAH